MERAVGLRDGGGGKKRGERGEGGRKREEGGGGEEGGVEGRRKGRGYRSLVTMMDFCWIEVE